MQYNYKMWQLRRYCNLKATRPRASRSAT